MTLDELRELIQNDILEYMDSVKPEYLDLDRRWVYDDIIATIQESFDKAFFAPAP